jgi:hypothetical protein
MTEEVDCFWLEPSSQVRVSLRRYSRGRKCQAGKSYCNADVPLTVVPYEEGQASGDDWPHEDSRWPFRCAQCGHPFREYDHYQLNHTLLYQSNEDDSLMTLAEAPPGAMWSADWYEGARPPGPDGNFLMVRLPGGSDWFIDGSAKGQPFHTSSWSRDGEVPVVTVHPSVKSTNWHGWLIEGVLTPSKK